MNSLPNSTTTIMNFSLFLRVVVKVTNGKNAMPAFGGRLSEEEIRDVAAYVYLQADTGSWDTQKANDEPPFNFLSAWRPERDSLGADEAKLRTNSDELGTSLVVATTTTAVPIPTPITTIVFAAATAVSAAASTAVAAAARGTYQRVELLEKQIYELEQFVRGDDCSGGGREGSAIGGGEGEK